MNNKGILVIDLELTCWDKTETPGIREIIQVGVVNIDPKSLEITKKQSYYVTPKYNKELSQFCKDLTGITDRQVFREGRPLKEVMETLSTKWGFSSKPIVFWGDDHLDFKNDCDRQNIENKTSEYTINFALQYYLNSAFKNKTYIKKLGLPKAMAQEGLDFIGRQHDALVDAENTARLYKKFHEYLISRCI